MPPSTRIAASKLPARKNTQATTTARKVRSREAASAQKTGPGRLIAARAAELRATRG